MADTNPDVQVSNTAWTDINTATGIVVGTEIILTNKSTSVILVQTVTAQPSADSTDGVPLSVLPESTAVKTVTAGESKVWAKSIGFDNALLSVQD